jgi:hypothetical protein
VTDDQLRSIVHCATHEALPLMKDVQVRARIQVSVAEFVIGAIRARERGEAGYGGMFFHD